jgi:hypothetical protein
LTYEELVTKLYDNSISSVYGKKLVDLLFETPLVSVKDVSRKWNISKEAANELVRKFEKVGCGKRELFYSQAIITLSEMCREGKKQSFYIISSKFREP